MPHQFNSYNRMLKRKTPTAVTTPITTPVVFPSPSTQNNDDPSSDQESEGSAPTPPPMSKIAPTPPISKIAPSLDRRTLIAVQNKSFVPKIALDVLKSIVHSHFDGPYSTWTTVASSTKEHWWHEFKKPFKWDEDQSPEKVVRKVFNHVGSKHLADIFQKAREKEYTKPDWLEEEIWVKLVHIWKNDEKFKHRSEVNKRNRAIATQKGIPVYKGGSISITEHKKRQRVELGKEPTLKETFTKCYTQKDGLWGRHVAQETVEKLDTLVEQSTQDAASEDGFNLVKSHSMIQGTTHGMHDEIINSTNATQNIREELRAELRAEITIIRSEFEEKMLQVERSLGEKVNQVQNSVGKKVDQLESSLQQEESTIRVHLDHMHKRIDNLVDKDTLFDIMTKVLKNHLISNS